MELSPQERKTLEDYIKVMTVTCCRFVSMTSQGKKIPDSSNLFDSAYAENIDYARIINVMKPSQECNIINTLNTSDDTFITLEIWTFGVTEPHQPNSLADIRSEMNLLLKNILKKASTTVSVRLEAQLPFIVSHYRNQPYESIRENYVETNVGQVHTPLGTFYVKVAVRTRLLTGPTEKEYVEDNLMVELLKRLITSNSF